MFYFADTVEPKDEKLNFEDWKVLASAVYPQATEDNFKTYFTAGTSADELEFA